MKRSSDASKAARDERATGNRLDGQDAPMSISDSRWLAVSPPLAVDDDEAPSEGRPPNVPPPDFTPEETPEQGSQD